MRNAERENLRALRENYLDESSTGVVGREDIEDVVSRWTGVPSLRSRRRNAKLLRIEEELHKRIIRRTSRLWLWHARFVAHALV
jgi:ATP-dependent Clp protease ATP-binding subunit ClpC